MSNIRKLTQNIQGTLFFIRSFWVSKVSFCLNISGLEERKIVNLVPSLNVILVRVAILRVFFFR